MDDAVDKALERERSRIEKRLEQLHAAIALHDDLAANVGPEASAEQLRAALGSVTNPPAKVDVSRDVYLAVSRRVLAGDAALAGIARKHVPVRLSLAIEGHNLGERFFPDKLTAELSSMGLPTSKKGKKPWLMNVVITMSNSGSIMGTQMKSLHASGTVRVSERKSVLGTATVNATKNHIAAESGFLLLYEDVARAAGRAVLRALLQADGG